MRHEGCNVWFDSINLVATRDPKMFFGSNQCICKPIFKQLCATMRFHKPTTILLQKEQMAWREEEAVMGWE